MWQQQLGRRRWQPTSALALCFSLPLLLLLLLPPTTQAFVPRFPSSSLSPLTHTHISRTRPSTHKLKMVLAPHDVHDMLQTMDPAWLSHVWQGLADAAAPALEVVEEVKKEPGFFDKFVNTVMGAIEGVHTGLVKVGVPGAYGAAIILFTAGVKLVLLPVTYKQMESAQRLQALAPKAKELKDKYGKNKQLLNQLTAKLYEDAEVNPLAGCLPALAQIPIFIALYRSLLNLASNSDFNEPFLWLPSLAGPLYGQQRGTDWLTQNWVDGVPSLGWHDTIAYLSIPVILIVTQSISQKLLSPPTPDDPKAQQTQRILKYLPVMVGYFSLSVPSGLGLYWITNNLITTAISLSIKEKFARNPVVIDVDVDPQDLGYDPSTVAMEFEEMLEEATRNPVFSRERKRGRPLPSTLMVGGGGRGGGGVMEVVDEMEKEKEGVNV